VKNDRKRRVVHHRETGFLCRLVDGLGLGPVWRFLAAWREWFFQDGRDGGM
jgi:hypothetical protein